MQIFREGSVVRTAFTLVVALVAGLSTTSAFTQTPAVATPSAIQPLPVLKVNLSAASASATYPTGSPIVITWTLANASRVALGLSALVDGNLVVTSFLRNGVASASSPSVTDYGDGFPAALTSSLQLIPAGASLSSTWTSDAVASLGGESLKSVQYSGADDGAAFRFVVATPGTYSLTFHYKYPGPTAGFPGTVFTGKTNSVTVTFTVI